MAWTKRERVLAVLSGEIPDRVPIFECLMHDGVMEHFLGAPLAAGDLEGTVRACAACLDLCHPLHLPQEPAEELLPDGTRMVRERWTTWWVPPREKDPAAFRAQIARETEEREAYTVQPAEVQAWRDRVRRVNTLAGEMVHMHQGTGISVVPGLNTPRFEDGVYLCAEEPALAERWNRACNAATLAWADAVLDAEHCPVLMIWDDLAYKNKLFLSPAVLERLFFPHLRAMCELAHSRGVKVVFHSDGDVTSILPALAACGIDGLNPLETSAGMDYGVFKEHFGHQVALVGGLDAVAILAHGTVDQVVAETRRLLRVAGRGGGLIAASASGEIDNSMPTDNVLAFWETVWEEGEY